MIHRDMCSLVYEACDIFRSRLCTFLENFRYGVLSLLHIQVEARHAVFLERLLEEKEPIQLLQGTLDLIVLRTLASMGAQHAYLIVTRLQQVSERLLNLNQGTLYPALVHLEQYGWIKGSWGSTESNREAEYYAITKAGGQNDKAVLVRGDFKGKTPPRLSSGWGTLFVLTDAIARS
jgi:PadR family transcriptional regulator PadR